MLHYQTGDPPPTLLEGITITFTFKFCYLGGTVTKDCQLDKDFLLNIWDRRGISIQAKLLLYKALILPTLLYGSKTWTTLVRLIPKIENFNQPCYVNCWGSAGGTGLLMSTCTRGLSLSQLRSLYGATGCAGLAMFAECQRIGSLIKCCSVS